jgi:hypothetical protein
VSKIEYLPNLITLHPKTSGYNATFRAKERKHLLALFSYTSEDFSPIIINKPCLLNISYNGPEIPGSKLNILTKLNTRSSGTFLACKLLEFDMLLRLGTINPPLFSKCVFEKYQILLCRLSNALS